MSEKYQRETNRQNIRLLWNKHSDLLPDSHDSSSIIEQLTRNPSIAFHENVFTDLKMLMQSNSISNVCVLASGDNLAACAFAALGLEVTSVDISENQIENARKIAQTAGLQMKFIVSDINDLEQISDNEFDLVYTSNGVLTWIDDLPIVFSEAYRILKKTGHYVLYEVHPYQRPWADNTSACELAKPYNEVGPIQDERNAGIFTFHWKLENIVNALTTARFHIDKLYELESGSTKLSGYFWGNDMDEDLNDWRENPLAGLPTWIEIISRKDA